MVNAKYILLTSVLALFCNNASAAEVKKLTFDSSGASLVVFTTYTTHTPNELKPISSFNSDNAVKLAAVCSIGGGGCSEHQFGFGSSNNSFSFDPVQQCKDDGYKVTSCSGGSIPSGECPYKKGYFSTCSSAEQVCKESGYTITSCTPPAYPEGACPHSGTYFKSCSDNPGKACEEKGYTNACADGKIPDTSKSCSYDTSYTECKCDPCTGFDYTLEQAQSAGWHILGEACNSCGVFKYRREADTCTGFYTCDDNGGEVGADTCMSGDRKLFASCKSPVKECASGLLDMDKFWCDGALRCLLPVPAGQ